MSLSINRKIFDRLSDHEVQEPSLLFRVSSSPHSRLATAASTSASLSESSARDFCRR